MSAKDEIDMQVMEVMEGQSPGYLISPFASAFVAVGLGSKNVELALKRLEKQAKVQYVELAKVVEEIEGEEVIEKTVITDIGWTLR